MTVAEIFTVGFFGVIGLAVFMFFLLVIIETCYGYKFKKIEKPGGKG